METTSRSACDSADSGTPLEVQRLRPEISKLVSIYAGRYGIPAQDHEDVTQGIMLSLVARFGAYGTLADDLNNPRTYLASCVSNACRSYWARACPESVHVRDAVVETLRGRRGIKGLALWRFSGAWVGGCEDFYGKEPVELCDSDFRRLQSALDARADAGRLRTGIPGLVDFFVSEVGRPVLLDDLCLLARHAAGEVSPQRPETGFASESSGESPQGEPRDQQPSPERLAVLREQAAAMGLYASGMDRARLCAWLWGLDQENLEVLFRACGEPSTWIRQFGNSLAPNILRHELDDLVSSGDAPSALHMRYASRIRLTKTELARRLRRTPVPNPQIAHFLAVTPNNVAWLRWRAHQELLDLNTRLFGSDSKADSANSAGSPHS